MVLPGVCDKKYLWRLEDNPWGSVLDDKEVCYTPIEEEILTSYEGVGATSEVIDTEAQRFLAP